MTTHPEERHEHPLVALLDSAHDQAFAALDEERTLDAVAWMSAHLAAARRALHKPAHKNRSVEKGLTAQHEADERLDSMLRMAERHVTGDVLASSLDTHRLLDALRDAIIEHARCERDWVNELLAAGDADYRDQLQSSYEEALLHAPTRPHPHTPHDGVLGAAAFKLDALRDRVLDTMDGRHAPTPRREREVKKKGPWGQYLLGGMHDDAEDKA